MTTTADLPEIVTEVRLHRAQQAFRRSSALFRGFVGGRGAGKTWAGAYDMLMRARPGRTYLVGSPTGVLLQDTTWPTFKMLALTLGRWPDAEGIRIAPYPTVTLDNGAVIRFRTAEDPERMRGPNLSGVWLDEASLMARGAYDVSIASLREQGEQGWLSASFTPQGLNHWTYELFGKAMPNTAIFHARTADNPFLPPGFSETIRQQYGELRAQQELGGLFVNVEGAEWPAEYFAEHIWADLFPTNFIATALALDPAQGKGEREKGCYAAFVFAGLDVQHNVWVDAWLSRVWDSSTLVENCLTLHKQTGAKAVTIETNGGQQFLADLVLNVSRQRNRPIPLYGINNTEDKEVRIRASLGPLLAQRRLRFRRGSPGATLLVQQLRDFPVGEYRDGPDALQMAIVQLEHLLGQLYGGARPRALRA